MKSPLPEADLAGVGEIATPHKTTPGARLSERMGVVRGRIGSGAHRARVRIGAAFGRVGRPVATGASRAAQLVVAGLTRVGRPVAAAVGRLLRPLAGVRSRVAPPLVRAGGVVRGAVAIVVARTPRFVYGAVIVAVVIIGCVASGTVQGTDATFVVMGFDPDRAQLITTLIVSAIAAATATLFIYRTVTGALLGTLGVAAMFGPTFIDETRNAMAARGALGSFDPMGWILTLLTLVVIGFVSTWAGATLAAAVRPSVIVTGANVVEMVKARRPSRARAARPLAAVLILGLFAITGPVFGDMVNLAPDSLMLNGGNFVALAPGDSVPVVSSAPTPSETPTPTPSATPSASESGVAQASPSSSPTPLPTAHASPGTKPWLAWKPSGAGKVKRVDMSAPWVGGTADNVDVNIYTPPGYDSDTSRRYPVLYEAPTGLELWGKGTGVISALDLMIDSGDMPASIVVFINSSGAVYPDSQCANSYDGKMWLEDFIAKNVVIYVDLNYRTIQDPNARGIMGMSAGGFCSAMLLTRHPDIYSTSISFSGYYWAGNGSAAAHDPYGGIQSEMDAVSPGINVKFLSPQEKMRAYFIVIASPTQAFYSVQADLFEKILKDSGVGFDPIKSVWEHGWTQVRNDFPAAVKSWSARMVVDGVW